MLIFVYLLVSVVCGTDDRTTWADAVQKEKEGKLEEARKLIDPLIQANPDKIEYLSLRGQIHFKLGKIEESLKDFQKEIALQPAREAAHWRRGLALYYGGKFVEGAEQFVKSDKAEPQDVENAVWHQLCLAKVEGVEKARKKLLKVENDSRIPMMKVYELFAGLCKPEEVLQLAKSSRGGTAQVKTYQFYAHLYAGLYHEMMGDEKLGIKHIEQAIKEFPQRGNYMMDVARVHLQLRK